MSLDGIIDYRGSTSCESRSLEDKDQVKLNDERG